MFPPILFCSFRLCPRISCFLEHLSRASQAKPFSVYLKTVLSNEFPEHILIMKLCTLLHICNFKYIQSVQKVTQIISDTRFIRQNIHYVENKTQCHI